MNRTYKHWSRFLGFLAFAAAACLFAGNAQAQQKKTVEHIPAGPHEVHVTMHHSTVLAVEGNHLVVRRSNGVEEALVIPEDFRFHMDGRALSVHELQPGMIVTETVTSTTKPIIVKTVVIDHGTVWRTHGENVVIRDKNNKLNEYRIPSWAKVDVGGTEQSVFDLRRDMVVTATIITEEPVRMVEHETRATVRHPVQPTRPKVAEQTPVEQPAEQAQPVEEAPATQPAARELPKTASPLPWIGLLGFFSLAASLGLRMLRKFF
ncbi:MAG: hypothetical protein KGL59_00920 [Acidobacteriota bacterium]|nr:hypothetical protein [Acidobacteriota bacterium]